MYRWVRLWDNLRASSRAWSGCTAVSDQGCMHGMNEGTSLLTIVSVDWMCCTETWVRDQCLGRKRRRGTAIVGPQW